MDGGLADAGGRIEFLSCGLRVHLPLLSTSPCSDAVTFRYRAGTSAREGLAPSVLVRSEAHHPGAYAPRSVR